MKVLFRSMASKLNDYGFLHGIEEIKSYLFGENNPGVSWFDHVKSSMNACGDSISFLYNNRLLLVKIVNTEKTSDISYEIVYKGIVIDTEVDLATCICTLSIALQQKSVGATTTIKTSTWNCIAIGFSSGYLRFYSETGIQLFEKIFHPKPISSLKYCHPKLLQDELLLIYPDIFVTIDGFSLHQCLRFCRLQQLKNSSQNVDNLSISYRKWYLQDQDSTNDIEFYGVRNTSPFEHLFQASLAGGSAHYIGAAGLGPVFNYISVGKGPFIAQYCPSENTTQPIMSEVVMSVATKLISYIPGSSWLSGWVKPEEPQRKFEQPQSITKHICVDDPRRESITVRASQTGNLAIIADNFGRLLLLDVNSMLIVNIWKGYRDAQCGWIQVSEEDENELSQVGSVKPRGTTFLVIYAKKRGILEVWCPFRHYRVGAFNVGKKSTLFCNSFHALGEGSLSIPLQIPASRPAKSCCFLLSENGEIRSLVVPFENALGEEYILSIADEKIVTTIRSFVGSDYVDMDLESRITESIFLLRLPTNISILLNEIYTSPQITLEYTKSLSSRIRTELSTKNEAYSGPDYDNLRKLCDRFLRVAACYEYFEQTWNATRKLNSSRKSASLSDVIPAIDEHFSRLEQPNWVKNLPFCKFYEGLQCETPHDNGEVTLVVDDGFEEIENVTNYISLNLVHSEDWEDAISELQKCGFTPAVIFNMFIRTCLALGIELSSHEYEERISAVVMNLKEKFENDNGIWDMLFQLLHSTVNPCQGFILAVYLQNVAVNRLEFTEVNLGSGSGQMTDTAVALAVDGNEDKSEDQDWVALTPEHEKWYTIRQQLWDTFVLITNTGRTTTTVRELLTSSNSTVTHITANKLIDERLIQNFIDWVSRCQSKDDSEGDEGEGETGREGTGDDGGGDDDDDEVRDDSLNWLLNIIPYWPYQLDTTAIFVCIVECLIVRWSASLDHHGGTGEEGSCDIGCLELISKVLVNIKSVAVAHSLVYVVWETVLAAKLRLIMAVVEKVGRQPKDRICIKETGLSLDNVLRFLSIARHLLLNVNFSPSSKSQHLMVAQENVWTSESRQWLLQKITAQPVTLSRASVTLQVQVIMSLELIASLNLKNHRPSGVFHPSVAPVFLTSLSGSSTVPAFTSSPEITKSRDVLLRAGVRAALTSNQTYLPHGTSWSAFLDSLAGFWNLSAEIQSYMCLFLYTIGKLDEANDILQTSAHRSTISSDLLKVLVAQLSLVVFQNEASQKHYLPVLTTSQASWLRSWYDPNVAIVDVYLIFRSFSGVLDLLHSDPTDPFIMNCTDLKLSLGKIL